MTFRMPDVDLTKLCPFYQDILSPIVENGKLVSCPSIFCGDTIKVIHSRLLKMLYRDKMWTVPVHDTWYMPHVLQKFSGLQISLFDKIVREMVSAGCFVGRPKDHSLNAAQYMTNLGGESFHAIGYPRRMIK